MKRLDMMNSLKLGDKVIKKTIYCNEKNEIIDTTKDILYVTKVYKTTVEVQHSIFGTKSKLLRNRDYRGLRIYNFWGAYQKIEYYLA